jgi:hypothetical protein
MSRLLPPNHLPTLQPFIIHPQQNHNRVLLRGKETVEGAGDLRGGGEVDVAVCVERERSAGERERLEEGGRSLWEKREREREKTDPWRRVRKGRKCEKRGWEWGRSTYPSSSLVSYDIGMEHKGKRKNAPRVDRRMRHDLVNVLGRV